LCFHCVQHVFLHCKARSISSFCVFHCAQQVFLVEKYYSSRNFLVCNKFEVGKKENGMEDLGEGVNESSAGRSVL